MTLPLFAGLFEQLFESASVTLAADGSMCIQRPARYVVWVLGSIVAVWFW